MRVKADKFDRDFDSGQDVSRYLDIGKSRRAGRGRPLTREELRSLWLNRAVAARVAEDPEGALARARRNLERLDRTHARTAVMPWLERWHEVIDAGPEEVMDLLTSKTSGTSELRQNSPFAGVLPAAERRKVIASFARYWESREQRQRPLRGGKK